MRAHDELTESISRLEAASVDYTQWPSTRGIISASAYVHGIHDTACVADIETGAGWEVGIREGEPLWDAFPSATAASIP